MMREGWTVLATAVIALTVPRKLLIQKLEVSNFALAHCPFFISLFSVCSLLFGFLVVLYPSFATSMCPTFKQQSSNNPMRRHRVQELGKVGLGFERRAWGAFAERTLEVHVIVCALESIG